MWFKRPCHVWMAKQRDCVTREAGTQRIKVVVCFFLSSWGFFWVFFYYYTAYCGYLLLFEAIRFFVWCHCLKKRRRKGTGKIWPYDLSIVIVSLSILNNDKCHPFKYCKQSLFSRLSLFRVHLWRLFEFIIWCGQ